jgi:Protein of unknown function (DUF2800)
MSEHSKLGGSGAERWQHCPGSVGLLTTLNLPESDEPDYRAEGTAAHEAAAYALATPGMDAWELVGMKFHDIEVTPEMSTNIQLYLDTCRADEDGGLQFGVEERVSFPEHPQGFGTVDHWCLVDNGKTLKIKDYKNGFLPVEVEENPQFMYYAFALLHHPDLQRVEKVELCVVQPNGFHPDGPVRRWETTRSYIFTWGADVLVPAMRRAELEHDLDAGSWCRFCPAKLVCPLLVGLARAAAVADPKHVVNLSDESLGREWRQLQAVGFYVKEVKDETYRRLMAGHEMGEGGPKLVPKRANRVWKDGAKEVFVARFGDDCYSPAEFKSPAEIGALGAEATTLVKEWAYTPQTGLTVVDASDPKPGVKVQSTAEAFGAAVEALGASG